MKPPEQNAVPNAFFTETDLSYAKWQACKSMLVTYLVLAVLAAVGLLVAWQTFLFSLVSSIATSLKTIFPKTSNHRKR